MPSVRAKLNCAAVAELPSPPYPVNPLPATTLTADVYVPPGDGPFPWQVVVPGDAPVTEGGTEGVPRTEAGTEITPAAFAPEIRRLLERHRAPA